MVPIIPILPGHPSVMNFKEFCPCVPKILVQNLKCARFLPSHKNKTFLTMCTRTVSLIVKTHLQGVQCWALFNITSKDQNLHTQCILQLTLGMISGSAVVKDRKHM